MQHGGGGDTARVCVNGTDCTLIAYGGSVAPALAAARAAQEDGYSVGVVDLRNLSPLDVPTLIEQVRRTGRAVVVHEASTFAGLGAEIAATITERCFRELKAPVLRVGAYNLPYPPVYNKVNPADAPILTLVMGSDALPLRVLGKAMT